MSSKEKYMLSERLRYLIDRDRITQGDFARMVDMTFLRAQNLMAGKVKNLKPNEVLTIRHLFKVNADWIEFGKGKRDLPVGEVSLKKGLAAVKFATTAVQTLTPPDSEDSIWEQIFFAAKTDNHRLFHEMRGRLAGAVDMVYVPRYDIKASAGSGALIHDESIVDHLAFKRDWLVNTLDCKPDSVCLVQVRGDSMKPTFNETDLLLLDMRTTSSRSEGVYVIQLKGALLVKRLRFKLSGVVDVISDNVKYGIESLTSDEVDRLTIIGRVVWHGAKF
jgi:phage repressor protein C with HTH and peptisase S24 domain